MKPESGIFENISEFNKLLLELTKKKDRNTKYWYQKWKEGQHYWFHGNLKNNKYYKQLNAHKLDNLNDMNYFLGKCNLSKCTEEK